MIKRIELFIRKEDQKETIRVYKLGEQTTKNKYKNPSARRGGMVIEYKNGNFVTIAQHKGDTFIYSSKNNKEYRLEYTHFFDVEVLNEFYSIMHCNPEKNIFSEVYNFTFDEEIEPVSSLECFVRIINEQGKEKLCLDMNDRTILTKLNCDWLESFEVTEGQH
ncbi:MAG: hypothetical protein ACRC6E_06750 [Fusobacteriaceae bacterium]